MTTKMKAGFSAARRRDLLAQYFAAEQSVYEIGELREGADTMMNHRLDQHLDAYARTCSILASEYRAGVPVVPVSRSPVSDEVLTYPIDTFGLDGLWWNYENPARPAFAPVKTFYALTGAVRLNGPVAEAPFLCKPGPEVPFVLPRLLSHASVKAVVSTVKIGAHTGYATAYFAKPVPHDVQRADTWGANHYLVDGGWDAVNEDPREMDFDLKPWIDQGKLSWIAPGDTELALHSGASGCPYLALPGRRDILRIEMGRVWTPGDLS